MGYNSNGVSRCVFDLETLAIDDAASYVEDPEPAKNLRDPEKIAADIEKKRAEQISKAALFPWTSRIVAIGVWDENAPEPAVIVCKTEHDEAVALREFWASRQHATLVGFASLSFDIPTILARCRLLGVPAPNVSVDRYRSPHTDLLQELTWKGAIHSRSLHWFCRRFGLPVMDEHKGKDVARLAAEGDWDGIRNHCLNDVTLTRALAERLGYIKAVQTPDAVVL